VSNIGALYTAAYLPALFLHMSAYPTRIGVPCVRVTKHALSRYFIFNIEYLSSVTVLLSVDAGKEVAGYKMHVASIRVTCDAYLTVTVNRILQT